MHIVQHSICASGPEIKQAQVGAGHVPGEREGPGHPFICSYSPPVPEGLPDRV